MLTISPAHNLITTFATDVVDTDAADRDDFSLAGATGGARLLSVDGRRTGEYLQWPTEHALYAALASPAFAAAWPASAAAETLQRYEVVYVDTAGPTPRPDSTAHIRAGDGDATMICEFHVAPDRQQALLDLLRRDHENYLRDFAGFRSVSFHRGHRGHVLEYLQFESLEQFQAVSRTELGQQHEAAMDKLGTRSFNLFYVHATQHDPATQANPNPRSQHRPRPRATNQP